MAPLQSPRDRACFIVGCGPSLAGQDLSLLASLPVYACNRTWLLDLPRVDCYYWSDMAIWVEHRRDIAAYVAAGGRAYCYNVHTEFTVGEKVAIDPFAHGISVEGPLRSGNSAAHTVANLAWRDGFRVFYLVGIDLRMKQTKRYPWGDDLSKDDVRRWNDHYQRSQIDRWLSMVAWVDGAGGRVISCSPRSVLNEHLPRATLEFAAATHGVTIEGAV